MHKVSVSEEKHSELCMVLVQGLVRLSLDLAATSEARGMARDWRLAPRLQIAKAMRSAAEQVRAFIEHLKAAGQKEVLRYYDYKYNVV